MARILPRAAGAALAVLAIAGAAGSARASAQQARPACGDTTTVATPHGTLCGNAEAVAVNGAQLTTRAYLGIPYGRAPVDSLRWQAPRDTSWTGRLEATRYGAKCMQDSSWVTVSRGRKQSHKRLVGSEACLFLNVWTPPGAAPSSSLPVMVFIHGGAFVLGSGSSGLYDGAYMAARGNVVVVTLNYRLGPFGFLSTLPRGGLSFPGNQGILDQQLALRWVQQSIAAFGGDPGKVTVFGESAGAMSVGLHLFSVPSSSGLFRAAIMESNPMGVQYRSAARASADGGAFLDYLCLDAAVRCGVHRNTWARTVPAEKVMSVGGMFAALSAVERIRKGGVSEALPWAPVLDSAVVFGQPYMGYVQGTTPRPFIFGMNDNEGVIFAAAGKVLDPALYNLVVGAMFGRANAESITRYRTAGDSTPYRAQGHAPVAGLPPTASALAQFITDFAFNCGNLIAADRADTAGVLHNGMGQPIFAYRFEQPPFFNLYGGEVCTPGDPQNVCHAYELPYVFHTFTYADSLHGGHLLPSQDDWRLSDSMVVAWTRFATDPTAAPTAAWQPYTPGGALYTLGGSGNGRMQPDLNTRANCTQLWYDLPPLNGTTARAPAPSLAVGSSRRPDED